MAARSGEKSSFAVACNLLSNYIKQKGGVADLGLGITSRSLENSKGEAEAAQKPNTMGLLPGMAVPGEMETKTKEKSAMDLFPQETGFGSSHPLSKSIEPGTNQLTIFYGGKVLVFDNFPAEKAKDLMNIVNKGTATSQAEPTNNTPPPVPVPAPVPVQRPARPTVPDLPIARKASLHRFLEKRKDRLNARAPYQVSTSPEKPSLQKQGETQPWLGLAPQAVKSGLSMSSECNQ
ncbi:protein TIFY 10a-like [Carex rostrata]